MQVMAETLGSTIVATPGQGIAECDPRAVVELLGEHGWVYFSGFAPTLQEFEAFTRRFGRCATPRVIHYPPGGVALGFHAEDSYIPWRPDALWFLCLSAGSDGGAATGVVDGVQLLQDTDDDWRAFSREHGLRFSRQWSPSSWRSAVGGDKRAEVSAFLDTLPGMTHEFLPDGTLSTRYEVPMVVRTKAGAESMSNTMLHAITDPEYYGMSLSDGSPVPEALLAHVEKLSLEREVPIGWNDGDVVVIDNYRLMHRRGEYAGKGRDLRVIHGEELLGAVMPEASSPVASVLKVALQGEEDLR